MKKYWLTWKVKGQKKSVEVWHNSAKEAETVVLKKYKPKAILYSTYLKRLKK